MKRTHNHYKDGNQLLQGCITLYVFIKGWFLTLLFQNPCRKSSFEIFLSSSASRQASYWILYHNLYSIESAWTTPRCFLGMEWWQIIFLQNIFMVPFSLKFAIANIIIFPSRIFQIMSYWEWPLEEMSIFCKNLFLS